MAPSLEIKIPSTATSSTSKPYTLYNITLRQPLRNWTLQKRFSEFTDLHTSLTSQSSNTPPPKPLPQKTWTWFKSTVSDPGLAEARRAELEIYLQAINTNTDARWRSTPAWRSFLNLPSTSSSNGNGAAGDGTAVAAAVALASRSADLQASITDPSVWMDVHREIKTMLRDARLALTHRDQASTAQAQHEASADAKRCLVRSGTLVAALERGLASMSGNGDGRGRKSGADNDTTRLGDGEIRRRKDLLSSAKKERETLEGVLSTFTPKSTGGGTEAAAASTGHKEALFKGASSASGTVPTSGRRVLGAKETDRTRELDNVGVMQLQKQIMQEQDEDVTDLTKVVGRMKQMGIQINEELVLQNEMLTLVDQDVERVGDKINIAKKRIGKIN